MDKDKIKEYLDNLFGDISYTQLNVAYMIAFSEKENMTAQRDLREYIEEVKEQLLEKGKTMEEIEKGLKYLEEVSRQEINN